MPKLLATLLLSSALISPALAEEVTAWRLFVGDHTDPKVTALDLETGDALGSFPLASPAALYTTHSGEAVFAVQGAGNQISAIGTGIAIDDHGDHGDIKISAPAAIEAVVSGERPVHFVEHNGKIALFFDGTGKTSIVGEHAWIDAGDVSAVEFDSGAPHHGVAAPWGDYTLISVPNPEDPTKLPIGINVLDKAGAVVGDTHGCADLHGEASSGDILAIACAEGLLLVTGSGEPKIEKIGYEGLPTGKATTLIGGQGLQYFLGNYGADKVVIIEPGADAVYRLVELPTRRVHFVTDPVRPRFAYIFTEDGQLRQLDVVSGELTNAVKVTEPYSMDGEWSLPRPRLAVAGDVIAVTDPNAGTVHLVDATTFKVTRDLPVEGLPYTVVAVGGSGSVH